LSEVYLIKYYRSVKKDLRKINQQDRSLIVQKIQLLGNDPRPNGVSKLQVSDNLYRIRVGDYRIIYEILDMRLMVMIVKVGHRGRVYDEV
jgi:mRNA interferase RelE/StbE